MEDSVTTAIISELEKSLLAKGLRITKLDEPITSGYSDEWEIKDSEGWIYASFGIKNGSYKYNLVTNDSLPFEAQSTIDWVKSEIIRAHQFACNKSDCSQT